MDINYISTNCIGQYIDDSGKSRALIYNYKGTSLSLVTSPLPPFNIPIIKKISKVEINQAISFINEMKMEIKEQYIEKDVLKGLWLDSNIKGLYYAYIPIKDETPLENVEKTTETCPISLEGRSALEKYRENKKIAVYLKNYTLYMYAIKGELQERDFIVIKDHVYDIEKLNKRLFIDGNDVMFMKDKLIVPSTNTIRKLLSYLQTNILNNKTSVIDIKYKLTIDEHYQSLSDFRSPENQLVFLNKSGLMKWKETKDVERLKITGIIDYETREPYFYRNPFAIGEQIMIVQNVNKEDLDTAITVSYKWMKDKVNIGYKPEILENIKSISYKIYDVNGNVEEIKRETIEFAPIIKYEDDKYASLLFFV